MDIYMCIIILIKTGQGQLKKRNFPPLIYISISGWNVWTIHLMSQSINIIQLKSIKLLSQKIRNRYYKTLETRCFKPLKSVNSQAKYNKSVTTNRLIDGQTDWQRDRLTERQTDRQTDWQRDRLTNLKRDRLIEGQNKRGTVWQRDRLKDVKTDRRTDWQRD